MRALSVGKPLNAGSSTLEILLAFVVITLALTAVVTLVFSNQSLAEDIERSGAALYQAQALLEDARAQARFDFDTLNATSGLVVTQVDDYTKQATAEVSWTSFGRQLSVSLSTLFTNPEGSESGEACSSVLVGNWANATLSAPVFIGSSADGNPVTGMIAVDKKLYITTSDTHGHNDDFYIYDASHATPSYIGSIDANGVTPGLNDVAISSTTAGFYVYAANANEPNWATCNEGRSCSQVQVLDVSRPAAPVVLHNYKIPATTTPFVIGQGGQGSANTIVYQGGYLYVGLAKTASGPEFVVLDVGGGGPPASPTNPIYKGSYAVGRGIADILVRRGVAYIATADNTHELLALNVSNPASPVLLGTYDAPGSSGFGGGNTLSIVGNTLYFGRNYVSNAPEFYVFNVSKPSAPKVIASQDIGTSTSPQSLNSIIIRDTLAFLTTRDFVQIWDIATSSAPVLTKKLDLSALSLGGIASACEGNAMYVGGYRTGDDKGVLYKLSP